VAVGTVVVRNSSVLLVRRGQEPSKGLWSVPGGLVELGETIENAARREVTEETGISIKIVRLLDVADNIIHDGQGKIRFHYVLIDFLGHPLTNSVKPQSDATEARWVKFNELSEYSLTKGATKLIQKIKTIE
jgi:mutator protein MutT